MSEARHDFYAEVSDLFILRLYLHIQTFVLLLQKGLPATLFQTSLSSLSFLRHCTLIYKIHPSHNAII
jgi:hypothetical protein